MSDGGNIHRRRSFLKIAGSAGVAGIAGLSGCSGKGGGDGGGGGGKKNANNPGGTSTTTKTEEKKALKIGFPTWLSGPLAAQGVASHQSAQIIIDWINENGGANGHKFELIAKDTKAVPDTAVKRTRQLIQQEDVDIIAGVQSSSSAKALNQYIGSQELPYVTAAQTPDLTKKECKKTTFRPSTNLIHQETALAEALARMTPEDATRVAGINPDYVYGRQSWDVFKKEFKERRPDVEYVNATFPAFMAGDYGKQIQQTLDANPDIVMSVLYSGDMISFIKQAHQYDFFEKVPHVGSGALDPVAASLGDQMPEMIGYNPTHWSYDKNERVGKWAKEYVKRYSSMPDGFYAAYGAQTIEYIRAAVEKTGGIKTSDLMEGLDGLTFSSIIPETTVRKGDNQGFHAANLVGRYGPVEESILPNKNIYGFTNISEVPASAMRKNDPEECELS